MLVGVVIPVYNERDWLEGLVEWVMATPEPRAGAEACHRLIVLVDDASTDGSSEIVEALSDGSRDAGLTRVISLAHDVNQGKGAAVRTGLELALAHGVDAAIIQDADHEYTPADHQAVLGSILDGEADAVIGSRFTRRRALLTLDKQYVANRVITALSNLTTGLDLTDVECCHKAMSRAVLERISIEEDRFGLEPELVAKLSRLRIDGRAARIKEVPVWFDGRTRQAGKKIGWRDGVSALRCIVKYRRGMPVAAPGMADSIDRLRTAFELADGTGER